MEIAKRLGYKSNFINYTYKAEMAGDAIENCIRVIDNFDPERSSNPFAYITQICFNAFIRRIKLEKTQTYIKGKIIEEMPLDEMFDNQDHDDGDTQFHNQFIEFLRENNYIDTTKLAPKKKKVKLDDVSLDEFFEDTPPLVEILEKEEEEFDNIEEE
jgi:DNA-directed RNA polymerase specialized sigma24 family protein